MALQDWSERDYGLERRGAEGRAAAPTFIQLVLDLIKNPEILKVWRFRARSRAELRGLSERQLWDIGLTREQARDEADKPFWRP